MEVQQQLYEEIFFEMLLSCMKYPLRVENKRLLGSVFMYYKQ